MNQYLAQEHQFFYGPNREVYKTLAVVDGDVVNSDVLPYKCCDGEELPENRVLFVGTVHGLALGKALTVRTVECTPGFNGHGVALLSQKVRLQNNEYIVMLEDLTPRHEASYAHHLRQCADIADEREPQYGNVLDNLRDTQMILHAMFGLKLSPVEIAKVMIAIKTSREKHHHKKDNLLDNINYHAILLEAIEEQERQLSQKPHDV